MSTHLPNTIPPVPPYYEEEEVTLKDIILKAKEYGAELWKYKIWILVAGILVGIIFFYRASLQKITYTAALTFLVSEENVSAASLGYSELGTELTNNNISKLIVLARSNRIINQVLFKTITVDEKRDFIANHLIMLYDFHKGWESSPELAGFLFSNSDVDRFESHEHNVLNNLRELLVGNNITGRKGLATISNNKSGLFNLQVITTNHTLSLELLNSLYETFSNFYIENSIGRLKRNYELLKEREIEVQKDLDFANQDLENELENNYTQSLNNAIASLTKLLENANEEKELAIKIANIEKQLETQKSEQELAIIREENRLALEDAKEGFKLLNAEKDLIIEKNQKQMELIVAENQFTIDKLNQELATIKAEKDLADITAKQLEVGASKKDLRKLANIKKEELAIAEFRVELALEAMDMSHFINRVKDSLSVDEEKVKEAIAFYKESQAILNDKELLELTLDKRNLELFEKEKQKELDSIRTDLAKIQPIQSTNTAQAIDINTIQNTQVYNNSEILEKQLARGEELRTKRLELELEKKSRKVNNLDGLYSSLLKNKQSIEFTLNNKTPEFQIIDQTFVPIRNASSKMQNTLLGFFLGGFLAMGFFSGRKLVVDALNSEE